MIIPIGKNVLIEPQKQEETTKLGIIISSATEDKPEFGRVLAAGPHVSKEIITGADVIFKKYAPDEVEFEDKKYLICEDSEILAVIENEK